MPNVQANGISIAYEEAGEGFPLVFAHEFAGSMESWQAQVHFFARRYRVITYNARGYPPTEVPEASEAYSQDIAVEDMKGLLDALAIREAYIAGLSMGGSLALHFGLRHPQMARALIVAAAGTGSTNPEESRTMWREMADAMERDGWPAPSPTTPRARRACSCGARTPPATRSSSASSSPTPRRARRNTMRGVQAGRPPIFVWEDDMKKLELPTLILCGDEDEPCVEPSIFMKRNIKRSGLVMFPQSGHAFNLEEPDLFNRAVLDFLTAVEAGKWVEKP